MIPGTHAIGREDLGEAIREYDGSGEGFIATQLLPIRKVKKESSTVSVLTRENLKRADVNHANGAHFNRVDLLKEDLTYTCLDRALEGVLTDRDRANFDTDFDAEAETVINIQNKVLIEEEVRTKDLLFNTTTWTGADLYTDNSSAPWDAIGTGIINQVDLAVEKVRSGTGMMPDSMVIGPVTMLNIRKNTEILARFPGATAITQKMIMDELAAIFGLHNLFVGGKVFDGAAEGQAFSGSDIWGDDYAMVFKRNTGPVASGGLGRTMLWTEICPENLTVKQYREEQTDGDVFRVRQFNVEKIFDEFFAHLMKIDA